MGQKMIHNRKIYLKDKNIYGAAHVFLRATAPYLKFSETPYTERYIRWWCAVKGASEMREDPAVGTESGRPIKQGEISLGYSTERAAINHRRLLDSVYIIRKEGIVYAEF